MKLALPVLAAIVTAAASALPAQATVLHFRNSSNVALNGPTWATLEANGYGDNVNATFADANYSYLPTYGATPDVTIAIDQPGAYTYSSGGAFPAGTAALNFPFVSSMNVTLTATGGSQVQFERFDIATFGNRSFNSIKVYLDGSATASYSATGTDLDFTNATPVSFRESGGDRNWTTPLVGSTVRLEFELSTTVANNSEIGFIGFSQIVPEPVSLGLLLAGGIAALSRRSRTA
jgi:hypothetical protein